MLCYVTVTTIDEKWTKQHNNCSSYKIVLQTFMYTICTLDLRNVELNTIEKAVNPLPPVTNINALYIVSMAVLVPRNKKV